MEGQLLRHFLIVACICGLIACSGGEERQAQYYDKAKAHFDAGDFKKARVDVRNVLQINENHPQARYLFALLHEQEKNWQQMLANLNLAVELDPALIDARIKLGQLFYLNGLYDKALEHADAVLEQSPGNPDGHTLRGSVFYKTDQYDKAVQEAEYSLLSEPGHVGAISVLTEVYRKSDPAKALSVIADGVNLQPENTTLKLLKISVLENKGDIEGVISEYKSLIAGHPENLFFHYRLVKYYEKNQRIDEAEALLQDIVKTKPKNVELKLWLAQFIANQRDLNLAEQAVRNFIEKEPGIYELRLALGKIYTVLRRFKDAENVYQEVATLDEEGADSLIARNEIVKLKLAQNNQAEAETVLAEIFQVEPENKEALITTAKLALFEKDTKSAIPRLRTVLKNDPKSVVALQLLSKAHEIEGAVDLAVDNLRQALAIQPSNVGAMTNLARLMIARGDFEVADKILAHLLKESPKNPEAQRLHIESLSKQGQLELALEKVAAYEKEEANKPQALYLKGRIKFAQKDFSGSSEALKEVLVLEPGAVEALQFLIRSWKALGKHDEAYNYTLRHVSENAGQAHAHELLGAIQLQRGDANGAIESFTAAVEANPNRISSVVALGQGYSDLKDFQAALKVYDEALEKKPGNLTLLILKAGILEQTGKITDAVDLYEQVLEKAPAMQVAKNNLAMILVDQIPSEESLERALKLVKGFENSKVPVLLDTLGWVHYRNGNFAQALPLFREAVESESATEVYYYHLGMTYYQLNNTASAKEYLQVALATGAEFTGAEQAREIIREL